MANDFQDLTGSDTTIDGEIRNLIINGVDVASLVEAELDRRYPDRPKFRSTTADGFHEAWEPPVRRVVDSLTDEQLGEQTAPLVGSGWPDEGETFPVRECLIIVLNEEWHHRLYAERDLAVLEERS